MSLSQSLPIPQIPHFRTPIPTITERPPPSPPPNSGFPLLPTPLHLSLSDPKPHTPLSQAHILALSPPFTYLSAPSPSPAPTSLSATLNPTYPLLQPPHLLYLLTPSCSPFPPLNLSFRVTPNPISPFPRLTYSLYPPLALDLGASYPSPAPVTLKVTPNPPARPHFLSSSSFLSCFPFPPSFIPH